MENDFILRLFKCEKMKLALLLIIVFFLPYKSQKTMTKELIHAELNKLSKADYENKLTFDSAIHIANHYKNASKQIGYNDGILTSTCYLMSINYRKGNYQNVIRLADELEVKNTIKKSSNNNIVSEIYRNLAMSYTKIGFYDQGYRQYHNSLKYAKRMPSSDEHHFAMFAIYNSFVNYFDNKRTNSDSLLFYLSKSVVELNKISNDSRIAKVGLKNEAEILTRSQIGTYYLEIAKPPQLSEAKKWFTDAEKIYNERNPQLKMSSFNEIEFLLSLSQLYVQEENYSKAIQFAEKCILIEKKSHINPSKRKNIYEILAKSYLEIGENRKSKINMDLYTHINDSINRVEKEQMDIPLNKIINENKQQDSKKLTNILWIIGFSLLIIFLIIYIKVKKHNRQIHYNYKELIKKLESNKQPDIPIISKNSADQIKRSTFLIFRTK